MRKGKNFKIQSASIAEPVKESQSADFVVLVPPSKTSVEFPQHRSTQTVFQFGPFYNKGFDDVVYNCQTTIESMLAASIATNQATLSIGTVAGYCNGGLNKLFAFCEAWVSVKDGEELKVLDINETFIKSFMQYLKGIFGYGAQRTAYFRVKSVLVGMRLYDLKGILPRNPYPNIKRRTKGEKSYSKNERKALVQALSTEMLRIKKESQPLSGRDISICLLWISTCTGINTQPLIELRVDALQPHLFHPHKRLLVTYKRRGKNTHISSLRGSGELESVQEMAPRIDAIFNIIEHRNHSLRIESNYPESLFIFAQSTNKDASATRITAQVIGHAAKSLVSDYGLKSDDGNPLIVNISRLRKTFVNRVFELSGYDPVIAAALAGHSVKVSDDHYLAPPPDAEKNHAFMGEVRNRELLLRPIENTPVASCQDSRNGHRAPKNGNVCIEVFGCFKCESFVVTADDLYRLFSFYFYVFTIRNEVGAKRWKKEYAYIIRIIERDIVPRFSDDEIQKAKSKASNTPHPLWRPIADKMAQLESEDV